MINILKKIEFYLTGPIPSYINGGARFKLHRRDYVIR